jgi:transcription elongation factor Elf1
MKDTDIVFTCRKCGHLLFVATINFEKFEEVIDMSCPNCGEEGYKNWILTRTGNYDEEYGE